MTNFRDKSTYHPHREKRYSLVQPQRTDTNIRFYSDDDPKKIINISALNANGYKISKIVGMSARKITKRCSDQRATLSKFCRRL